jgi:mannan endo-1,4-beta-mannosidase
MKKSVITIMAVMAILTSCGAEKIKDSKSVRAIIERVSKQGKVMFGHQDDTAYGHTWSGLAGGSETAGRSDVKETVGDYPAVMGWDLGGLERGDEKQLDGIPATLLRRLIVEQAERGGINTISWHSYNPSTGGSAWDVSGGEVVKTIIEGGENHAKYREQLCLVADFLASLKRADGTPVEVIFRPWHEHTGGWFWWGDGHRTAEEYKQLWRETVDYLREERGLSNLIFAYSPNLGADRAKYMETYPGDEYVDLLGFDIYQFGGADGSANYIRDTRQALGILKELGRELGKPTALTETGVESVADPRWWTDVLWPAVEDSGISYLLVWRNAWNWDKHHYAPYPGHASAEDFKEFYAMPQTVFLNDIIDK